MQMSKRVKGSISVLLTMILLPMMTYATMIIDASRLQLVRNNIAGAGDLALNAIMSEYNIMLEEMYGLFANTTSEEELQDVLKAYFQQTIEGRFLPQLRNDHAMVQDTVNKMLDLAMNKNGYTREGITDFLALQLQDFSASAVTGSALANPAAMRRQITEYMKYRGPVSIGSTLLGKLDFLKDSGQQVDACDAKVTYAESLSGLHDPCMEAYRSITGEYNNGALLMNELIGQGLVGKKLDGYGVDTNRLLMDNGDIITYAKQNYQYATAFALMNARSPFANNNRSLFIDGVRYDNYAGFLNVETQKYKEKIGALPTPSDDIIENIDALNQLLIRAGEDCGYDENNKRLQMIPEDLNVSVVNKTHDRDVVRTPGALDRYDQDGLTISSNNRKEYTDPNTKIEYHYPIFEDMLVDQRGDADNYYHRFESFIDMKMDKNNQVKNNKIPKNETETQKQFDDQYAASLKVLEAQQELAGPLANGIQYIAQHQARLSLIQESYDKIWSKLSAQLNQKYTDEEAAALAEKVETSDKERKKWITEKLNALQKEDVAESVEEKIMVEGEDGEEIEEITITWKWKQIGPPDWTNNDLWVYYMILTELNDEENDGEIKEKIVQILNWVNDTDKYTADDLYDPAPDEKYLWNEDVKDLQQETLYNVLMALPNPRDDAGYEDNLSDAARTLSDEEKDDIWNTILTECHYTVDANRNIHYDGMDQINKLEESNVALNKIQTFFKHGHWNNNKHMGTYEGNIDSYIARLAYHNDSYFGRYEDAYIENGSSSYMGVLLTLRQMQRGLETAVENLTEVLELVQGDIKTNQTAWQESINKIESDSTRASMTSDYNSMISQINDKEVENLLNLVTALKAQIDQWNADINSCKYLGQQLVTAGSGTKSLFHDDYAIFREKVEERMKMYYNCGDNIKEALDKITTDEDETAQVVQDAYTANLASMKEQNLAITLPNYTDTPEIKEHLPEDNDFKKAAEKLVADTSKFSIPKVDNGKEYKFNKYTRYTILDGLKDLVDDNQISAPTGADKETADIEDINLKYQLKGAKGMGELIDPDEVFMITLYSEAKAEENAANADTDVEAAGKNSSDSIQAIANAKSEGADADPEEKAADKELNKEDFGTIMTNIQEYCEAAEDEYTEMNLDGKVEIKTGEIKTGKEASKSKAGGGLKEAKKILNEFTDIGTTIVENVYLEEYFTEMFTCRTDNQRLNSLTKKEDANALPVILLNGYGNEASGASKQLNEYTEWYGKEIEYLLWGNDTLNSNLAATDATIFAIRFALNAIYAFTAPEIIQYVNSVATALAGWTVIGVPIIAACLTIALAIAESGYDIYLLHDGQDVPIYKDRTTFACSPVNALKNILETAATEIVEGVIENAAKSIEDKLDDAVDGLATKFGDLANKKISDCAGDMETFVNDFGNDQVEAIRSAIRKQFFAPIQNQLIQIGSLMDINEKYEKLEVDSLLDGLIDQTLQEIKTNVSNTIASDSVVYQVCDEIFKTYFNDFKAEIVGVINDYFANGANNLTDILQAPVNEAANQVESLEAKFNAVVDRYVTKIDEQKGFITDKIGAVKDSINQAVKAKTDEAATSIKSFMHEQITVGTQQLTGMVGTVIDEAKAQTATSLKKEDVKGPDTGLASRVTLNYKEYCKILMLIIVNVSSETVLQRAGVLITANMRHPEHEQTVDFNLTSANTLFSVNANVNMMTLFPWPVKDVIDEANPDSGIQLDLTHLQSKMMTLSYCGINGY